MSCRMPFGKRACKLFLKFKIWLAYTFHYFIIMRSWNWFFFPVNYLTSFRKGQIKWAVCFCHPSLQFFTKRLSITSHQWRHNYLESRLGCVIQKIYTKRVFMHMHIWGSSTYLKVYFDENCLSVTSLIAYLA